MSLRKLFIIRRMLRRLSGEDMRKGVSLLLSGLFVVSGCVHPLNTGNYNGYSSEVRAVQEAERGFSVHLFDRRVYSEGSGTGDPGKDGSEEFDRKDYSPTVRVFGVRFR